MVIMPKHQHYVVCVQNRGHKTALERRKIYRSVQDKLAAEQGLIRVIDESGADYLYPEKYFVPIELPAAAAKSFV